MSTNAELVLKYASSHYKEWLYLFPDFSPPSVDSYYEDWIVTKSGNIHRNFMCYYSNGVTRTDYLLYYLTQENINSVLEEIILTVSRVERRLLKQLVVSVENKVIFSLYDEQILNKYQVKWITVPNSTMQPHVKLS
jgi:hypothetical protein